MTDDFKLPPYITRRCDTPAEWRADAENDAAWLERDRKIAGHATALYHTLERILATTPGTVERAQAEICGHNLIRRIGREP